MTDWGQVKQDLRNNALFYLLIPIIAIGAATAVAAFRLHGSGLVDRALHYASIALPLTVASIAVRCWLVSRRA